MQACWSVDDTTTMQLLLDCSVLLAVLRACQETAQPIIKDILCLHMFVLVLVPVLVLVLVVLVLVL